MRMLIHNERNVSGVSSSSSNSIWKFNAVPPKRRKAKIIYMKCRLPVRISLWRTVNGRERRFEYLKVVSLHRQTNFAFKF